MRMAGTHVGVHGAGVFVCSEPYFLTRHYDIVMIDSWHCTATSNAGTEPYLHQNGSTS